MHDKMFWLKENLLILILLLPQFFYRGLLQDISVLLAAVNMFD